MKEFIRTLWGGAACPSARLPTCLEGCRSPGRDSCQALCRLAGLTLATIVISLLMLCTLGGPIGHALLNLFK